MPVVSVTILGVVLCLSMGHLVLTDYFRPREDSFLRLHPLLSVVSYVRGSLLGNSKLGKLQNDGI